MKPDILIQTNKESIVVSDEKGFLQIHVANEEVDVLFHLDYDIAEKFANAILKQINPS